MKTIRVLLTALPILLLVSFGLAGCSGGGGEIEGVNWRLTSYALTDGTMTDAIPDASDAAFGEGTVSGKGGVNSYSGAYTLDGGAIDIQPVASTLMAGDAKLMAQESAFFAALDAATEFNVDGTELTLSGPDGDLLTFEAAE